MTNNLADKLEVLAAKATPGLLEACSPGDYGDFDGDSRVICSADPDDMRRIAVVHWSDRYPETDANADLIVALHNNLPEIIRALRERDQVVEALREMTAVASIVNGSFALRGEYMWDKHDEAELEKAEDILASIEGAGRE